MATRSKLEQAVKERASELNDAQREIVKSQLSDLKRNKARIAEIEAVLGVQKPGSQDDEKAKIQIASRMALISERNQLVSTNNEISESLFNQLTDKKE